MTILLRLQHTSPLFIGGSMLHWDHINIAASLIPLLASWFIVLDSFCYAVCCAATDAGHIRLLIYLGPAGYIGIEFIQQKITFLESYGVLQTINQLSARNRMFWHWLFIELASGPCSVTRCRADSIHGRVLMSYCCHGELRGHRRLVLYSTIGTPLLNGALLPWGVSLRALIACCFLNKRCRFI